jgi:hypothetical protein
MSQYSGPLVSVGSKADKPSRAKIHLCPLLSNSGQIVAVPRMSAMCQSRPTHCKRKDRQLRRSFRNPIRRFDQAAARAAAAFCFLRRARRPITPRPVAKSGRPAGRGAPLTAGLIVPTRSVNTTAHDVGPKGPAHVTVHGVYAQVPEDE